MIREKTKNGLELVQLNLDVLRGKLTITKHDADGNAYEAGPSIQDRQRAVDYLTERGFGKVMDVVQMQNPDGTGMFQGVAEAASTRDIRAELIRRGALTETGRLVPTEN